MKKRLMAVLSGAIASCLIFSACGSGEPAPNNDEKVGGDWRTHRGYTAPYQLFEEDDTVFSMFTSDELGYAAYENTDGKRIGALVLPEDERYTKDNLADEPILNKDLNSDGVYEFGVAFKDGSVVWYGWDQSIADMGDPLTNNPLLCIGFGDANSIQADSWNEQGDVEVKPLTNSINVRGELNIPDNSSDFFVDVYDDGTGDLIGSMKVSVNVGIRPDDLETGSKLLLSDDPDGDGIYDLGVRFKDGQVYWYSYHENNEPEQIFIFEGAGNENGLQTSSLDDGVLRLSDTVEIKAVFGSNPDYMTIDILDVVDDTNLGTIQINDPMVTANDVVCLDGVNPHIVTRDLNNDGIFEVGVPLLSGIVYWYGLEDGQFLDIGTGTEEGIGLLDNGHYLSDGVEIKAVFGSAPDYLTIDILKAEDNTKVGTVQFNDPAFTANDVVCLDGENPEIITRDLDQDGTNEVGIPMLNGIVYWYGLENGDFLDIGAGTAEGIDPSVENNMIDTLFSVLGSKLDGMKVIRVGNIMIDDMNCEEYGAGTDHEEHFVMEQYYAVAPDGTVYYLDILSNEYLVYEP